MKTLRYFLFLILFLNCFIVATLKAQISAGGTAIVIDTTVLDQSLPKIRAAQNGWLFAGFITGNDYRIFRSKDNGSTWVNIVANKVPLSDWDLEVTGGSVSDTAVTVWISSVYQTNSLNVFTFNGSTGAATQKMVYTPTSGVTCKNTAIATDDKNPGFVADPYSIAVAVSLDGFANDSLLLFISNDGGGTWKHSTVYSTINYLHRVSLGYGYSPANNEGRFFLAGEYNYTKNASDNNQDIFYLWEREDFSGIVGPGYLDSVNINWATNIGHPDIIVQNSSAIENDSLDLSAIILFNVNNPLSGSGNGLKAIATMTAIKNTTIYKQWHSNKVESQFDTVATTTTNGVYNNGSNDFIFAAGDILNQSLSYYKLNIDSIGAKEDKSGYMPYRIIYTDTAHHYSLSFANPQCDINPLDSLPVADWIGNRGDTATYTLFNARDTPLPSGIYLANALPATVKIFPNPAYQYVDVVLPQQFAVNTQLNVYNLFGQNMYELLQTPNLHIRIDVSRWQSGSYYIRLINNKSEQVKKLVIERN